MAAVAAQGRLRKDDISMRRTAGLLLAVMLTGGVLSARRANDAGHQCDAERQRAALRDRIENHKGNRRAGGSRRKGNHADALKRSRSAISKINLRLQELARCRPSGADRTDDRAGKADRRAGKPCWPSRVERRRFAPGTSGPSPWTAPCCPAAIPQMLGRSLELPGLTCRKRAQCRQGASRADISRLAAQARADARR